MAALQPRPAAVQRTRAAAAPASSRRCARRPRLAAAAACAAAAAAAHSARPAARCCCCCLALPPQGKIKSLEQIYLFSLAVKEYQIVDYFLGSALKDEVRARGCR